MKLPSLKYVLRKKIMFLLKVRQYTYKERGNTGGMEGGVREKTVKGR